MSDDAAPILDAPESGDAGEMLDVGKVLAQFQGKPQVPDILNRYLNGETATDIARETKVARSTLYLWMLGGLGDKHYHDLVTAALVQRISDADHELDKAKTRDDIAKAREKMRFYRMDLERRRPKVYGPKQEYTTEGVVVHVNRNKPEKSAIDVTPQKV